VTVVAGLIDAGAVWMAADGVSADDGDVRYQDREPKLVRHPLRREGRPDGAFLLGAAGSPRLSQRLRRHLTPPQLRRGQDPFEWTLDLADLVQELLAEGKGGVDEDGKADGSLLVGIEGRLFDLDGDYAVHEARWGYSAIGCADTIALGALYATRGLEPRRRLRLALGAATRHEVHVGPPFLLECLTPDPP
jgi:hypothetical protein